MGPTDNSMQGVQAQGTHSHPRHQLRSHKRSQDAMQGTGAPGHNLESSSPKPSLISLGLEKHLGPRVGEGTAALRMDTRSPGGQVLAGRSLAQLLPLSGLSFPSPS